MKDFTDMATYKAKCICDYLDDSGLTPQMLAYIETALVSMAQWGQEITRSGQYIERENYGFEGPDDSWH